MDTDMGQPTKQEVLDKKRARYARAGLPDKHPLADQAVVPLRPPSRAFHRPLLALLFYCLTSFGPVALPVPVMQNKTPGCYLAHPRVFLGHRAACLLPHDQE